MTYVRSGGSDASAPLNTNPSLVPAQPAVSTLVNPPPGGNPANWDYSMIPDYNPQPGAPTTNPAPTRPVQSGNLGNLWGLLAHLFGGSTPGPPQGMRGLMQPRGQGAPGTNSLGNPFNRF